MCVTEINSVRHEGAVSVVQQTLGILKSPAISFTAEGRNDIYSKAPSKVSNSVGAEPGGRYMQPMWVVIVGSTSENHRESLTASNV